MHSLKVFQRLLRQVGISLIGRNWKDRALNTWRGTGLGAWCCWLLSAIKSISYQWAILSQIEFLAPQNQHQTWITNWLMGTVCPANTAEVISTPQRGAERQTHTQSITLLHLCINYLYWPTVQAASWQVSSHWRSQPAKSLNQLLRQPRANAGGARRSGISVSLYHCIVNQLKIHQNALIVLRLQLISSWAAWAYNIISIFSHC